MCILCLAWGSLIWNPGDLPVGSAWRYDGPELPVEFTRQSINGRITLAITEGAAPLRVFSAVLDVASIDDARTVLADREQIPANFAGRSVGHWTLDHASNHREAEVVDVWARAAGHHGIVWTALKPKFVQDNITPTKDQIVKYLSALSGERRKEAEIYIRRTPAEISTSYRRAVEQALGWTPIIDG